MDAVPPDHSADVLSQLSSSLRGEQGELLERLVAQVYDDLRRVAHRQRRGTRDDTLGTTALVHEAYLKLSASGRIAINDRAHFFALAGRTMRQILVDHARAVVAAKRGGRVTPLSIDEVDVPNVDRAGELVALDAALARLAALDPALSTMVELRFFAGLSIDDTAGVLGMSASTVKRDWRRARAFLLSEMDMGQT